MSNLIHLPQKKFPAKSRDSLVQYNQNSHEWQDLIKLVDDIKTQIKRYTGESRRFMESPTQKILQSLEQKLEQLEAKICQQKNRENYLIEITRKLHHCATIDGLTQVANRYWFDRTLEHEWHRLMRHHRTLSIIFCDVDFFKGYNDYYGHQAGDECLQKIAQAIRFGVKRSTDLVARYGGEEFVVILPETDQSGAIRVAAAIRSGVEQLKIPHAASSVSEYVTVSLGVSTMIPHQGSSPEKLVAEADARLYEAKQSGRNCVKYSKNYAQNHGQKISVTLKEIESIQRTIMIHWSFDQKNLIRIGRAADNDIVLHHPLVSRHHLKLQRVGQTWQLESFGQNGTYINDREVEQILVNGGEIIKLARFGPALQIDLVNSG